MMFFFFEDAKIISFSFCCCIFIHFLFGSFGYNIYLCGDIGSLLDKSVMKRESGESPEQTRCCKFHNDFQEFYMPLSIERMGRLLKRNKSEDLPVS